MNKNIWALKFDNYFLCGLWCTFVESKSLTQRVQEILVLFIKTSCEVMIYWTVVNRCSWLPRWLLGNSVARCFSRPVCRTFGWKRFLGLRGSIKNSERFCIELIKILNNLLWMLYFFTKPKILLELLKVLHTRTAQEPTYLILLSI